LIEITTKLGCAQDFLRGLFARCQDARDVLRSRLLSIAWEIVMMILKSAAIGLAVLAVSAPARADDATSDSAGGRYVFNKTADGVVRLDTQNGQVSLCSQRAVGWACETAPEDRAVLENEIARLRAENGELKKDILSRGLPLPPGAMPEPSPEPPVAQNSVTVPLPSNADIDRMAAFANQVWHRFKEMVERAQQQILNKS
jgi:hypothetical protein